jgi:hypothetical protein
MTGWGAVVLTCVILAVGCLVWLIVTIVHLARNRYRNTVWTNAMRLAVTAPDLVAQVAAEAEQAEDPEPAIHAAAEHVASIDELPHAALVQTVLTQEAREAELIEQVQNTQTDAITLVAQALGVADAQRDEAIRQTKAKRRHWSTVKRLKGTP